MVYRKQHCTSTFSSIMIQVDIGGHPPTPLGQSTVLNLGGFSIIFWVLSFQGCYEALNDVFLTW